MLRDELKALNSRWVSIAVVLVVSVPATARLPAFAQTTPGQRISSPSPAAYQDSLQALAQRRMSLGLLYEAATTDSTRLAVIHRAQSEIARSVTHAIAPFWYGTRWAFDGVSQTPGIGAVACGYFVTTVLRDAGFAVERRRLAQQPSELIIKSLVGAGCIERFSDVPVEEFVRHVATQGHGLYVVGLDIHVGFLAHDAQGTHFIHSSYMPPLCVLREDALESRILSSSRYRVLGKLTEDKDLAVKWLTGVPIPTRSR